MELCDAVRARRMVRAYQSDRPVPDEAISRLLDLGTRAPSAGFTQGWDFLVLTRSDDLERYWTATRPAAGSPSSPDADDPWLAGMRSAPVLILCLSDRARYLDRYAEPDKGWTDRDPSRWPVPYWDVDTGMAAMVMLLSAVDQDLGSCFFGVPADRMDAVLAAFAIPPDRRVVGVISLGHPAPDRRSPSLRRGRRPIPEVAHHGRFGVSWTV